MRHPEDAYVRPDGIRDLTVESRVYRRGAIVTVNDAESPRVVQLNLTPEGLDFLIGRMPEGDGFTNELLYAKRLAKDAMWIRGGGSP